MDEAGIATLFTRPVAAVVATVAMGAEPLAPEEARAVARAVERRRREFAAGRAAARAALARLGQAACPIPAGPHRAPVWPAGFIGSITHCDGFCCAVAARAGAAAAIGVDAEDAAPLSPAARRIVLRPDELAAIAGRPDPPGSSWGKLAFSAKEAVYKAWFPLTGTRLAFHDLSIAFAADGGFAVAMHAAGGLGAFALDGRWRTEPGLVFAGVTAFGPA